MNVYYYVGMFVVLFFALLVWTIYTFYRWMVNVNEFIRCKNLDIDNLYTKTTDLEKRLWAVEKVTTYARMHNTSYNEGGIGSINPSEADTE